MELYPQKNLEPNSCDKVAVGSGRFRYVGQPLSILDIVRFVIKTLFNNVFLKFCSEPKAVYELSVAEKKRYYKILSIISSASNYYIRFVGNPYKIALMLLEEEKSNGITYDEESRPKTSLDIMYIDYLENQQINPPIM